MMQMSVKKINDDYETPPAIESKERECWKFLDWQLNSENDSRLHGQPSFHLQVTPLDSPLVYLMVISGSAPRFYFWQRK